MPEVKASIQIAAAPEEVWRYVTVPPGDDDPVDKQARVSWDRDAGWHAVETPGLTVISDVMPADGGTELTITWQYYVTPRLLSVLLHSFTRRWYRRELAAVLQKVKREIEQGTPGPREPDRASRPRKPGLAPK